MIRIITIAILAAFTVASTAAAGSACSGADPVLSAATVTNVTPAGGLNQYHFRVTVVNDGTTAQANDTLQFVNIYNDAGDKLDAKGVPPLAPGQAYTVNYELPRSRDAGNGTSHLAFELNPVSAGAYSCNTAHNQLSVIY